LLLKSLFTIPRASEIKVGAKSSLLLHPLYPGRYIDTNDRDSICYDLITQVATLGLRLEDELGVRGRECTID